MTSADQAIGVFDSGIGGLSVLRHIRAQYPGERLLYLADQAHVPYGSRSVQEIQEYSSGITRFLLDRGAKAIVVACNTASSAALSFLRDSFPDIPIVGMEPAVKPAALITKSGVVGVLATPATFASPRYSSLMARFAEGVTVLEDPCEGLVSLIEDGRLDTPATARLLNRVIQPMIEAGVDTIVLGCTHYPLVLPLIEATAASANEGTAVNIIDPAPAVARQLGRVLAASGSLTSSSQPGSIQLFTTADAGSLDSMAQFALGEKPEVVELRWRNSTLETGA